MTISRSPHPIAAEWDFGERRSPLSASHQLSSAPPQSILIALRFNEAGRQLRQSHYALRHLMYNRAAQIIPARHRKPWEDIYSRNTHTIPCCPSHEPTSISGNAARFKHLGPTNYALSPVFKDGPMARSQDPYEVRQLLDMHAPRRSHHVRLFRRRNGRQWIRAANSNARNKWVPAQ